MGDSTKRNPMKLYLVFLIGFIVSLVVVGGMIWLFAAYETANWWPWSSEPRLSQDKWFEVVRNSVTTAAALGVGITLFFSYRRQQTAEHTQRIGAEAQLTASKAQETAAKALELSNKQHELSNKQHALDEERRKDAVISELRLRYGKSAEQLGSNALPVKLAGVYSLAALADDWADAGILDERQVCIDLLCAVYRSVASHEAFAGATEFRAATFDVIRVRLTTAPAARRFWGATQIYLGNAGEVPLLDGIILREGGSFTLSHVVFGFPSKINRAELDGGYLGIHAIQPHSGSIDINDSRLLAGSLGVFAESWEYEDNVNVAIRFRKVTLDGTRATLTIYGGSVTFTDCLFKSGSLTLSGLNSVHFIRCRFERDVFEEKRNRGLSFPLGGPVGSRILKLTDCTFAPGVPALAPYDTGQLGVKDGGQSSASRQANPISDQGAAVERN